MQSINWIDRHECPRVFLALAGLVTICFTLCCHSPLRAQWRHITDFSGSNGVMTLDEPVTYIYFLDLPEPPRIGFVGTECSLFRTSDGGKTWAGVWDTGVTGDFFYISGICFKDSLTGWMSVFNGNYSDGKCYEKTDGGLKWGQLMVSRDSLPWGTWGAFGIFFNATFGRLFLSCVTKIRISTDLGNSWTDSLPFRAYGYSYSDSLHWIIPANRAYDIEHDTSTGFLFLVTSNGGVSWDTVAPQGLPTDEGLAPVTRQGSLTCLGTIGNSIFRSDDFGRNWRQVGTLPGNAHSTGYMAGNFSRLYLQNSYVPEGIPGGNMFVSNDSGATWFDDGGPGYDLNDGESHIFYAGKGVTYAAMTGDTGYGYEGLGLYEEIWPQSSVQQPELSTGNVSLFPNPTAGTITISGMQPNGDGSRSF